jgi:hypothetical protein
MAMTAAELNARTVFRGFFLDVLGATPRIIGPGEGGAW